MNESIIVLTFAEVFLKRGNRRQFLDALRRNIAWALRNLPLQVTELHGRFVVIAKGAEIRNLRPIEVAPAVDALQTVFGLHAAVPAVPVARSLESIRRAAIEILAPAVTPAPQRFRVTTRRADKTFPMKSFDLNRELGIAAFETFPQLVLDLYAPELELRVEIGRQLSFISRRRIPLAGGLPVGTAGKTLLLLSGGLDSPVAGYLAMKRGCQLEAIYFHSFPYVAEHTAEKVKRLGRLLARYQQTLKLHIVPFTAIQETIRRDTPSKQYVLLYRRFMLRIADAIARKIGADALITGEAISQVASQTLANIRCIEAVTPLPVLRPLVTFDKSETIILSRRLGFYETSIEPHDDCCSLFVDKHPETKGSLDFLRKLEATLPVAELVDEAVAKIATSVLEPQ